MRLTPRDIEQIRCAAARVGTATKYPSQNEEKAAGLNSVYRSVTVTTPSGKVKGTKRRMLFFKNYPDVEPGSTIALRMEPPEPPEEREPFDWDRAFSRTMQTTTTLLTILVLLDRLN